MSLRAYFISFRKEGMARSVFFSFSVDTVENAGFMLIDIVDNDSRHLFTLCPFARIRSAQIYRLNVWLRLETA